MTGRLLALALLATAPFLAPGEARDPMAPGAGGGPLSAGMDGHAADAQVLPVTRGGTPMAGATYFIDAARLADIALTTGKKTDAHPGLAPGLTLVLNRGVTLPW